MSIREPFRNVLPWRLLIAFTYPRIGQMMFSIGMATYDDFDGVYFTAMSLLAHHSEYVKEIIIIDNNPNGPVGQSLREFAANASRIRYVPYTDAGGTSQPRNEVFRQAKSDYVVCLDSHVLLLPGALQSLAAYYRFAGENCGDLIHGPLVMDNLEGLATHFEDVWRAEMWGVWGFDERAKTDSSFEIPAQGLGLFACKRDKWLGFNPAFRGFGGEEWYIHEKYRKAGRRVVCVSGLKWVHRFGRPRGVPYPLSRYHRVRNYCIGLQELGMSLDRVQKHFAPVLQPGEWESAVRGDIEPGKPAAPCGCAGDKFASLDEWCAAVKAAPSDINEHCDTLAKYAAGKIVVDCGSRFGVSTVALAAGKPEKLTVIAASEPREVAALAKHGAPVEYVQGTPVAADAKPHEGRADLVFLDTTHTANYVLAELKYWAAADRIILHDTVTFGERGEDGGPGIMHAIRAFLRERPEWIVKQHDRNNNGLIVLSRLAADRKALPGKGRMAANFMKAISLHVVSGAQSTPHEAYEARLGACDICPSRNEDRCGECGCYITEKAKWKEQRCPLEHWKD